MAKKTRFNSLSILFLVAVAFFYCTNSGNFSGQDRRNKKSHRDVKANTKVNETVLIGENNIVKESGVNETSTGVQRFIAHFYEDARNKSDTKFDPRTRVLEMKIFTESLRKRMRKFVPVYESQFMKEVQMEKGVLPAGTLRFIKKWKYEPDEEGEGGREANFLQAVFASTSKDWTLYKSIEGYRRTGKRKRVSRLVDPRPRPKDALLIYTIRRFYESKYGFKYIKYVMPKYV